MCVYLENSHYRLCGLDLVTDDDHIFCPLATDGEEEMEEYVHSHADHRHGGGGN